MAIIKGCAKYKYWRGCGEKRTLLHYYWECSWFRHYGEPYGSSSKKLKIQLPYDPAIPFYWP